MTSPKEPLTAVYELDEDGETWLVHLAEDERAHTYGRTFGRARDSIWEVAALWFQVDTTELEIQDRFPSAYQEAIDELDGARAQLAENQSAVAERTRDAVRLLRSWSNASERDIAKMIGLSHQRVHQLVTDA